MRTKYVLKNLRQALQQDYLYNEEELKFMREQLQILEEEVTRTKPKGFK